MVFINYSYGADSILSKSKNLHTFTNEDYTYGKLSALGMSFGYQVNNLKNIDQLFPVFDIQKPNLIIIDSALSQNEIEHILKYLFYLRCPYAILFLGNNPLIEKPYHGMKEVMSELNILGKIEKPIRVEDIMEKFDKIENESENINAEIIKNAIDNNQFELFYQPVVHLKDQQIKGAEALIRWNHPNLGLIGPDRFIPLSEKNNAIFQLTEWTFDICMKQLQIWQKINFRMELAINLSEKILNYKTLSFLKSLCEKYHIDTSYISLEITESAFKKIFLENQSLFQELKKVGFKLTIDEFELSHFTLSELFLLDIDCVKINRIHVLDLDKNEKSKKMTKSIIDVMHNIGLKVGATGIESAEVWELLTGYQCDIAQGYYICKPVSVKAFNQWVGIDAQQV
jgi:EAL domain-containing protein (putative c-di-GMP-specific phosphodiesterase class I)